MKYGEGVASQLKGHGGVAELVGIAVPLVVSFACGTVMMFTDRLFMSRLGGAQMSAVMAGGLTAFTLTTFIVGIHGYSNAMVARQLGAGRKEFCPVVTAQALIISFAAYPLLLGCIPLGAWIFRAAGIAPEQMGPQRIYFTICMVGTIISLMRGSLAAFFSGIGRTRIIMVAAFASMVTNVGLNYLLIFGKAGFPALGIKGAAIGTVIADFVGLVIVATAYLGRRNVREFSLWKSLRFDRKLMVELLRTGSPAGAEMLFNTLAFTTLVTTFHSCGVVVATAVTITFNWDLVAFVPMNGLNIAVNSLAGRYVGAKEIPSVYRAAWSGMKLSGLYSALLFILFLGFTGPMVSIFLPASQPQGAQIGQLAQFMVKLISVYLFCDGVMQVFGGALRGVGDTFWVMLVSVGMHWMFAAVVVVLLKVLHLDARTTWTALVCAYFCFGPLFFMRFRSGRWEQRIKTTALATAVPAVSV